jgi:hypothetical protein
LLEPNQFEDLEIIPTLHHFASFLQCIGPKKNIVRSIPTLCAGIRPGDIVVDLGSGAGNDSFIARHEVGVDGKVVGIDFTPAMVCDQRTIIHTVSSPSLQVEQP